MLRRHVYVLSAVSLIDSSHKHCGNADGPVCADKPNGPPDLRLILGGKFLENSETLNGAPSCQLLPHPLTCSIQPLHANPHFCRKEATPCPVPKAQVVLLLLLHGNLIQRVLHNMMSGCHVSYNGWVCWWHVQSACADLKPSMGELKADTIVTMHVIVRPAPAGKPQSECLPQLSVCNVHRLVPVQE